MENSLPLYDKSHCIKDDNIHFKNQVAVLRPDILSDEYCKPEFQLFYCTGGFGCSPTARGRKVYGEFLSDGEAVHFYRQDFIEILKPELLPEWAHEKVAAIENKQKNKDKGAR